MTIMTPYENFDNSQAMSEGWAVFHTTGTNDDGDFRIERLDEEAIFADDQAAWDHVIEKAAQCSAYHQNALRFIRRHNETEFALLVIRARDLGLEVAA